MIRSTKNIMVSSENFDFEFSAFLTAVPKKHAYFYFVVVLSDKSAGGGLRPLIYTKQSPPRRLSQQS